MSRESQLAALADAAVRAVAGQDEAAQVVSACGLPGPPAEIVMLAAGRCVRRYHQLEAAVEAMTVESDLEPYRLALSRYVAYHLVLVRAAVDLACAGDPGTYRARSSLDGLGPPADDLRRLHEELLLMTALAV
jgi:hypothetical protein